MALHDFGSDEALLSLPISFRIRQDMNHLEVETRLERFEFFPERDRFPVLAAIEQDHRALVATIGERANHAHHGRDADAAGDQHVHVGGVPDGEGPVGTVYVDAPAHRHFINSVRQVAQFPDRHLDTSVGDLGTG